MMGVCHHQLAPPPRLGAGSGVWTPVRAARFQAAWTFLACALASGGCVSLSPRGAFDEVQATTAERTGARLAWRSPDRPNGADEAVEAEVAGLLQDTLTADAAVQIALLNNRQLQALYEELGVAQADLVEAGLLKNPVFEAEYRFPGRPDHPWELHVVQDFVDVFFIPLRRKAAGAALEAAKLRVADAVLEHAADTRRQFYRVQGAAQLVDMRHTALQATQASALLAERQHQAGNISDLDLANEQALHEQTRVDLALAEIEALEQRERLNERMGMWGPQAADWSVEARLPEPPADDITLEGLESLAVSQRLDLAAARRQVESLAQTLGLARNSALLQELELGAHVEREPDGEATWGPSVGLRLPVFSQGQPAVARAAAQLRRSEQRTFALAVQIRSEVRSARNRMTAARQVAEHYRTVLLPLKGRIVEESQLHYNAMQIGPFQLLAAKRAELEAGRSYVDALMNYWTARADLERAVGGRLEVQTEAPAPTHGADEG